MEDSVKGLLEAEEKAAMIVEQANQNRTKKLLEAKAVAEKDIAKYKQRQTEIMNEEKDRI